MSIHLNILFILLDQTEYILALAMCCSVLQVLDISWTVSWISMRYPVDISRDILNPALDISWISYRHLCASWGVPSRYLVLFWSHRTGD